MNEVDYWVSKVRKDEHGYLIALLVHDSGRAIGLGEEMSLSEVEDYIYEDDYRFQCIYKKEDGKWYRGNVLDTYYDIDQKTKKLPLIQTKRKTFISYYHYDDSEYKEKFLNLTEDLIVSKSVEEGDIKSDLSDEYVKQLIQKEYLHDTTVLVVLLGPKTKCRKHIDWEISGALNYKVGESYTGILGLKLLTHPDYGTGKHTHNLLPNRLSDNLRSGYAVIRDYTTDRQKLQEYIELAYKNRRIEADKRVNNRIQMQDDICK